MFDKLKYNNLLISGSKEIQKAKIQVLRKIIQKVQKLKKLIEKRPDDETCKIKLRKCLEIVESAKKIKRFEALTNILLLEKSPNKIVTNSRSTPEEVAIAMLASNETMKALIKKIREELSLNESDLPTWRKTLVQISKQKVKTQRKKKRKQALKASGGELAKKTPKSKKKIKKNKTSANENEILSTATEKSKHLDSTKGTIRSMAENEIDSPKVKAKTRKIKLEPSVFDTSEENSLKKTVSKKKKESKPENSLMASESKITEDFADLDNQLKCNTNATASKKSKKSNSEKALMVNESKTSSDFTSLNNEFKTQFKATPKTNPTEVKFTKVVDPFFLTPTGENYVAIVPVIEASNEATDSTFTFKETKKISNEKLKVPKPENQKIHPSWEAKQKQRMPVGFQGKRKTFGHDTEEKKEGIDSASDLHPSWLAKQKLKPTITAFQGKKIKFEDD